MKLPDIKHSTSIYDDYVTDLHNIAKTHPPENSWLPFPNQRKLTEGTRRTYRGLINRGERLGPGYEASIRAGWLYVRVKPH